MTEKRYKVHSMIKGYEVGFDDLKGTFCELRKDGKSITYEECCNDLNRLTEENEQLKQKLEKYSNWCNSVKKENIDKVLKMSVFEIIEAFEYYDKKIKNYERILNGDVK